MPHRLAFTINNKTLVIRQRFVFAYPPFIFARAGVSPPTTSRGKPLHPALYLPFAAIIKAV